MGGAELIITSAGVIQFVSTHLRLSRTLAVMPAPWDAALSYQSSCFSPLAMAEKKMALVDRRKAFANLPWFALVVAGAMRVSCVALRCTAGVCKRECVLMH